ncbi:MAG: O-antigen ligase family protein [Candidatus Promineifilaceae bacterium]|nr:O-antigen ligase family protein [Candidatus Promineifilaceae bacterium]
MGVGVLLAMAVIVVVVGLLTVEWSPEVPGLQPLVTGASGVQTVLPVVNPNEVAGVLLWVTPLAVALAARSLSASFYSALPVPVPRVLLAPATVLIASITTAVLVMTRSRSALLGLVAGAFFLGLVALRGRRVLQALAALALAFILAAPLIFFREQSAGLVRAVFGSASVNGGDLFQRVEIWQRALYGLEDFFLTGMGIGTFRHVVHVLYPLFSPSQQVDIGHAHNHLLQAGLDLGIPGLIAYTALWLITARMLLQTWQTSRSAWLRLLGAGFAGSLLAYFIFGVTDAVALGARPGFIFWYLLGLVASLHQIARVAG